MNVTSMKYNRITRQNEFTGIASPIFKTISIFMLYSKFENKYFEETEIEEIDSEYNVDKKIVINKYKIMTPENFKMFISDYNIQNKKMIEAFYLLYTPTLPCIIRLLEIFDFDLKLIENK